MSDFTRLVSAWLDGDISDVEIEQLHGHLHQSEANVRRFAEQINLNYLLRKAHAVDSSRSLADAMQVQAAGCAGAAVSASSGVVGATTKSAIDDRPAGLVEVVAAATPLRRGGWLARRAVGRVVACAVGVALVLAGVFAWKLSRPAVELIGVVGAQFVGTDAKPGSDLVGKTLELSQGFVELLFRQSDATLVIEAPAQFRVEDAGTLRVDSGRVTAHVRDGKQGLRVLTPEADVFDLGTRFAVDVTRGRRSEVHVFEGKVEAGVARSGSRQLLTSNEALRFEASSQPAACDFRMASFVQPEELRPLAAGFDEGQHRRARRAFDDLTRDPAILAAIDFEGKVEPEFIEINGAQPAQGRFPGQTALDFVDVDDRVHMNWTPTVERFTLMTWVRLNSELGASNYSSVYHTDGWGTPGQVHWMVKGGIGFMGRMRFAIHGEAVEVGKSETFWAVSDRTLLDNLNRWTHLALTFDSEKRQVAFYVDGRFDTSTELPKSMSAVLGPAEIGNWSPQPRLPRRRLCGRMDELLILSRALSEAEIHGYYRASTPYR